MPTYLKGWSSYQDGLFRAARTMDNLGDVETSPEPQAIDLLRGLGVVMNTPHDQILEKLSALVQPWLPHDAIASLVNGCIRSPLSTYGDTSVGETLSAASLSLLAGQVDVDTAKSVRVNIDGTSRVVLAVAAARADARSLLAVVLRDEVEPDARVEHLLVMTWKLIIDNLSRRLAAARPEDLVVSRAVAAERIRLTAELTVRHRSILTALVGVLRSSALADSSARQAAVGLAASALVELRATVEPERVGGDEVGDAAFQRLRDELQPVARYATAELVFSGPDSSRHLPAGMAQVARAIARNAVLILLEQEGVTRVRVAWSLGDDLTVMIHDDGPGLVARRSLGIIQLNDQAEAVDGNVELESLPGWGTRLVARLPLTVPQRPGDDPFDQLQSREREVLELVEAGRRNVEIAEALNISANTVKFHVGNILRKLKTSSRGEAAALVRRHRSARTTSARRASTPDRRA